MLGSERSCAGCCHCPKTQSCVKVEPVSSSAPRQPTTAFSVPAADIGLGPLLLTVEQAGQVLAIGRTAVYALLGSGVLASVRIGRSRRIPLSSAPGLRDPTRRRADASAPG